MLQRPVMGIGFNEVELKNNLIGCFKVTFFHSRQWKWKINDWLFFQIIFFRCIEALERFKSEIQEKSNLYSKINQ
jgi:hypothetical protein